jgi:hypothetical protein
MCATINPLQQQKYISLALSHRLFLILFSLCIMWLRPPPPTKTEKKSKEKKKSKERPPAPTRPQDSEPAIMQPDQDLPPAYHYAPAVGLYS